MKKILITGGAGYLGLNISLSLIKKGYNILIVDNLENAYIEHIESLIKHYPKQISFLKGDVCDNLFMKDIFSKTTFDIVLHLAAYKYVDESIQKPELYSSNNINSLKNILNLCENFNVKRFAFASSAVVYGNTDSNPIDENTKHSPLSPYAKTKSDGEEIINNWHKKTNIPVTIFRFSNPAGANTEFMFGDHSKKGFNNLIPYIVKSVFENKEMIFKGNDHPTKDGSPIRDYIHITDLANIVTFVLDNSLNTNIEILNISRGKGFSLLDIIKTTSNLLNKQLKYNFVERNKNESSVSILNPNKLLSTYKVSHQYGLDDIISSQIEFYKFISTNNFKN